MPRTKPRNHPAAKRAPEILSLLRDAYPEAKIALEYSNAFECVVATVLSAQSTDAKVNEVTKTLFKKYRKPEDYLAVPEGELKEDLRPTGFFNQKTKRVRELSDKLLRDFGGKVPKTIAELITLPGVARKTANVVQANCYPKAREKDPDAGLAVDTHVGRVSVRLALTNYGPKEAVKIERDLMALLPKEEWAFVTDLFIEHGRRTCDAKRPECERCPIEHLCPSSQVEGLPDLYRIKMQPAKKARKPPVR